LLIFFTDLQAFVQCELYFPLGYSLNSFQDFFWVILAHQPQVKTLQFHKGHSLVDVSVGHQVRLDTALDLGVLHTEEGVQVQVLLFDVSVYGVYELLELRWELLRYQVNG
jgi:hypothetical protein